MIMHPHPYSLIFPSMSREEYSQLSTDIAKNGLLEPITVYQGMVLDGRNRDIICHNLGITPKIVEFTGTDQQALDFVISKNLHRRHLSASQRAMVATSSWFTSRRSASRRCARAEVTRKARKTDGMDRVWQSYHTRFLTITNPEQRPQKRSGLLLAMSPTPKLSRSSLQRWRSE